MTPSLLTLRSGRLELILAPQVGGSIAGFFHNGPAGRIPILRGAARAPASILEAGSFPLVPYVNRIRDGAFAFRGHEVRLEPNMAGDPSPLHGQGWLNPWEVAGRTATEAELTFRHEPGQWPWRYQARQLFRLDPYGLDVLLTCENLSGEPMPCGLGQHPYFPCDSETLLETGVTSAWTIDEKVLPLERVPAEGPFDLARRRVCGQSLDHGFEGWSGRARISHPRLPFALEMLSAEARFFQLYSPASGGLFVAEPVTHRNAALNEPEEDWQATGLRVLQPGEQMSLLMRLALTER